MREILKFPLLTVLRYRAVGAVALLLALSGGCSIKRTIRLPIQPGAPQYRTAGFDQIIQLLRSYDRIDTLTGNIRRLTLTTGRKESGQLERYPNAPGYMLLKRPDSFRLVVQNPITKTTVVDILSVGDELSVWYPHEDTLYLGKNSARELIYEDPRRAKESTITLRGSQIFEAVFPPTIPVDEPGIRVAMTDDSDGRTKYYVVEVLKEGSGLRMPVIRRIWIERVGLSIARQQVFTDEGQVAGDFVYSDETDVEGFSLPQRIRIDRPLDAYSLDVEFKNWRINNPDLHEDAFIMPPHPGAQIVHLKERGRSNAF